MFVYRLRIALKLALLVLLPSTLMPRSGWAQQSPALLAQTPPMGWNSWDAYGLTITEAQFRANVRVLAPLRSSGWRYAVIDEGWYMQNPLASKAAEQQFHLDAHGRLIPAPQRFPSSINDAGLKPIADWVHAQGLLFGIHLIRGIPRESVRRNLPIAGSHFTAAEVGDPNDVCPWDDGNYGVRDNATGQAWYDSMVALYASWGVDFLKVDCISDHPYKATEIRQIAAAIRKTGRPIVLSLSPGPTALIHAPEVARYAQMWRIADDHWDIWSHPRAQGQSEFPLGTRQAFDRLAEWNRWAAPGHWPDEDMLPFGVLKPHPGWGSPRVSRLTPTEERTEFTLWSIARSPLIMGANLTRLDPLTRSLMQNQLLIALNQNGDGHPRTDLQQGNDRLRIWESTIDQGPQAGHYLAVFNLGDQDVQVPLDWKSLKGKRSAGPVALVRDVTRGTTWRSPQAIDLSLAAHGSAILRISADHASTGSSSSR